MTHISALGFTMKDLFQHVEDGMVRIQTHPEFPHVGIFNYTEIVQFKKQWDDITMACRGLIINTQTEEVIARPWRKFFNFGERNNEIDSFAPVEVTDKVDGSLAILYRRPDGKYAIATRGSFASEQALEANKIWEESYSHLTVPEDYTFLFEILVPWNRIVVQYDYDSEYLQQGRGVLPQRSSQNDTGEHLYSAEQGLEDLSSVQKRGSEARQGKEWREEVGQHETVAQREFAALSGTIHGDLQEDSSEDSGSQEGQAVRGLRANVSSGVHGLRPSAGNREEVQYRGGKEPRRSGRGNSKMRTGVRELPQNQDVDYAPGNLVLLGAVNKEYGYYYGPGVAGDQIAWPGPRARIFYYDNFVSALSAPDRPGQEGIVIRSGTKMVKLKQADYIELHRIVTNLNPKAIWEMLQTKTVAQICENIPDEFHSYVESIGNDLMTQATEIMLQAKIAHAAALAVAGTDRKKYAAIAVKNKSSGLLFALFDNKDIRDMVWKMVKPRGNE